MLHHFICIMCLTTCAWYWAMLHQLPCNICLKAHPWNWALLHQSQCNMWLTACLGFEHCYTSHSATCGSQHVLLLSIVTPVTVQHMPQSTSLELSIATPVTVQHMPQSTSLELSIATPVTVQHVAHSMSCYWALLHQSQCNMWLTVYPWNIHGSNAVGKRKDISWDNA